MKEPSKNDYFSYFLELQRLYDQAQSTWSIPDLKKIKELQDIIRFYYQFATKKRED